MLEYIDTSFLSYMVLLRDKNIENSPELSNEEVLNTILNITDILP